MQRQRPPRLFLLPTAYLTKLWNLWDIVTLILLFTHITIHTVIMQELFSFDTSDRWTQYTRFDEELFKITNTFTWSRSIAALNLVFCTLKFLDLGKGLQYDFTIIVITMFDMLKRMIQFIMVLVIFGFAWWFFYAHHALTHPRQCLS